MKQPSEAAITASLSATLNYVTPFGDSDLGKIVPAFRILQVKRNTSLLAEGDVCKSFYFVYSGSIRTFYVTRDGQEKTRYIMLDHFIGTALTSFISQTPSFEWIDALEDSTLLAISHNDFYRLVKTVPAWALFYQKILEMAYTFQSRKIESRVTLTAKQRFDEVMTESPQMMQRLSNKVLASYLDVRQETLSRLKSK